MVARCVGQTSYEIARGNLAELCQIYLSVATIGNLAEETAGEIAERLKNNPDVCLDIYHGAEHISECGKVLFGGTAEQKEGLERMRNVLLSEGLSGERVDSIILFHILFRNNPFQGSLFYQKDDFLVK